MSFQLIAINWKLITSSYTPWSRRPPLAGYFTG